MSESLITDLSRAFHSKDGASLPSPGSGRERGPPPKHSRALGVPGSPGGGGCWGREGWRWVRFQRAPPSEEDDYK